MLSLMTRSWTNSTPGTLSGYGGQYSGNGIGGVTCVYVNPILDRFRVIDYRIYDPEGDGKTKLHHVKEMLSLLVYQKHLLFQAVLMDCWYAAKTVMLHIENLEKEYDCPLKINRLVDDSNATEPYQRIENLAWTPTELNEGKRIKIRGVPRDHKVKLFRVMSATGRTDDVVTNDFDSKRHFSCTRGV